ncbi:acyl-CoA N-acyltransferase [Hygrophoropsis aurantiaca]|uniref:Acyl-CoA N-acyltransferase n=1 Tax=Hygrophoropsis aurantiaca TaxID=72124 RepID=A0ACB8ATG3_9AGAM|nr:acyl-CoA N-acyltransferase [Hygrophoropsis aurantiaca]
MLTVTMSESYINGYTPPPPPPPPPYDIYGPDPYDINVAFPLDLSALETASVKLVPFIPRTHFAAYLAAIPDLNFFYRYFPFENQHSADIKLSLGFIDNYVRKNENSIVFAVIDKTRPDPEHEFGGSLAGTIALLNHSPSNLSVEIGVLCILPAFQRTHVATQAVGTLLRYSLALPSASVSGLGLRRVYWYAHPDNNPSVNLAKRMGLKKEGIMRWAWVLPEGKESVGMAPRGNDLKKGLGRDTIVLATSWQDWEGGGKELVDKEMARTK